MSHNQIEEAVPPAAVLTTTVVEELGGLTYAAREQFQKAEEARDEGSGYLARAEAIVAELSDDQQAELEAFSSAISSARAHVPGLDDFASGSEALREADDILDDLDTIPDEEKA